MHTHIPVNDTHYLYTVQVSSLIPVGRMPNDTMTTSNDSDLACLFI